MKSTSWRKFLPIAVFLVIGIILFPASGRDDSHITYWASFSLSEFGHILNYNYQIIEISSSLTLTLILSALHSITALNLPLLGSIISVFFGAVSIYLVYRIPTDLENVYRFLIALITGSCVYFIYWGFSGMETTLESALLLLLIVFAGRYLRRPELGYPSPCLILILLLLNAVRPETPIVLICSFLSLAILDILKVYISSGEGTSYRSLMNQLARIFVLLGMVVFTWALLILFRYQYFGRLFPHPVFVKSLLGKTIRTSLGARYIFHYVFQFYFLPLFLVSVSGAVYVTWSFLRDESAYGRKVLTAAIVTLQFFFILFSGGDWMEGARFIVPVVPLMSLLTLWGLTGVKESIGIDVTQPIIYIILIFQLMGVPVFASTDSQSLPIWVNYTGTRPEYLRNHSLFERLNLIKRRDLEQLSQIKSLVKSIRSETSTVSVLSSQGGIIPYYLVKTFAPGEISYIDQMSLVTKQLLECPIKSEFVLNRTGPRFLLSQFLRDKERYTQSCFKRTPDILHLLLPRERGLISLLEANDYSLVFSARDESSLRPKEAFLFSSEDRRGIHLGNIYVKTKYLKNLSH